MVRFQIHLKNWKNFRVGHKTASVVMSQGFGFETFPVDTHTYRLMYRWGLSTGKNVGKLLNAMQEAFSKI